MNTKTPPPVSIKIIAWLFIVYGLLQMFSAFMVLLLYPRFIEAAGPLPSPPIPRFQAFFFSHYSLMGVIELLIGVVCIISGVYFVKLRSWARTALEVVTWLGLASTLPMGVLGVMDSVQSWSSFPDSPVLNVFLTVFVVIVSIFWIGVLIFLIRFFRSAKVRQAVASTPQ